MPLAAKVPDHLIVLLKGRVAGELRRARGGSHEFVYDDRWRHDRESFPLSLSMPLAARGYDGERVAYYLRALLPDSEARLNSMAFELGVPADDAFALLAFAGEDCAGAVQFIRPDRLQQLTGEGREKIQWLSDEDVAQTIRELRSGREAGPHAIATEQCSLPGALAKVALTLDPKRKRWGLPSGRTASTHIIKPPIRGVKYHNENEFLSLELARLAGNRSAGAFILRVDDQSAIAVERFDRERRGGVIARLHQEDLSQALGVNPRLKYSGEGAPGIADGVRLLREHAGTDDAYAFLRGVAFNWIIAGTDAHPRNYSVLLQGGANVELAPLYDLASGLLLSTTTPADQLPFAMTVAGRSRIGDIGWAQWAEQAQRVKLNPIRVAQDIDELLVRVIESSDALNEAAAGQNIDDRFATRFIARVGGRARALQAAPRVARHTNGHNGSLD